MYTIKKGEKFPIKISLKNSDEDKPIDLTGSVIKFQLKDELRDEFYIIEKNITESSDEYSVGRIIDPKNGELILRFTDEDYDKLVYERIYYATIWWEIPEQDFAKVISSNGPNCFKFIMCIP